jgi:deoxyribonucleoside regulator
MSDRLILKVCHQHYRLGRSHTEIAENLRISRFQVARLLREALESGYVSVSILEPVRRHSDLEDELEGRFGLQAAVVIDNDDLPYAEARARVADAAGRFLLDILRDGDVLGVSLGSTVQALVDQLPQRVARRIEVVQLVGGSAGIESELSSVSLTAELARRFQSPAHLLFAPAVVNGKALRRSLLDDPTIQATFAVFRRLTVAVLGIGSLAAGETSRLLYGGILDDAQVRHLLEREAVGDVLAYVFRRDGTVLGEGPEERLIALPRAELERIPKRMGVVAGEAKAAAIEGALRAGLINVLITDSRAAAAVCEAPTATTQRAS